MINVPYEVKHYSHKEVKKGQIWRSFDHESYYKVIQVIKNDIKYINLKKPIYVMDERTNFKISKITWVNSLELWKDVDQNEK